MAATKLTAPNGASVSVDSGRVENLLRHGFTKASETKASETKATAKKAASTTTAKKASSSKSKS